MVSRRLFYCITGFGNVCVSLGLIFFIYGSLLVKNYYSGALLSIPLYPKSSDGICDYVGVIPDNKSFYNISNPGSFSITFPSNLFRFQSKRQMIYLIHNLWGYNFNISITESNGKLINFHNFSRNNIDRSLDQPVTDIYLAKDIIPDEFSFFEKYVIYCPISTLITKDLNIEPECNSTYGAMTKLSGGYQKLQIGSYGNFASDINLTFYDLTAIPMNYIFIPTMFLAFWSESDAELYIISASVIFPIGSLVLIAACILFLCDFVTD